ncbi:MAG TPA: FG-GAP-like repeat-containing protein, partial [Verrucomicrobiae bacterium]|nr:FG-GAP-like repeat-containing protein [Verrucomicrobiae bacterium]
LPDVAVAAPYAGEVLLFINQGGSFGPPLSLPAWPGARNLRAGDFDADGHPDLVIGGTTNGLRQLRTTGGGAFVTVTNITSLSATNDEFPKPFYVLTVFRPTGATHDELVATHADSRVVWVLAPGASGALGVTAVLTNQLVHTAVVGPITQPGTNGVLDLVTASRDFGTIEVHRGTNGPGRFEQRAHQKIYVPGGPRALSIADLDGDGWNDVVVVLRNFDRVFTYHNSNGVLVASTEMVVGKSPRELVTADFNGDGHPDVAVMNRDSMDVSVLLTHPSGAGFSALDLIYPVDGGVSGLSVLDFNGDGRDDVVQLHRASSEFSVRLAGPGGLLGAPTFYSLGAVPGAQCATDVNNDGFPDIISANLGRGGDGSISVRLSTGSGTFGPQLTYFPPGDQRGGLFAIVTGDFDLDGNVDLAAGYYDCRISFFRGNGNGTFTYTRTDRFTLESRVMVAGDFDNDGDLDIAGAGYAGDVVVIENKGDLLTTTSMTRYDYPPPGPGKYGTRDIVTADVNSDGDLDLVIGSGNGAMLYLGQPGMGFVRAFDTLPGTDFPASGLVLNDFDGDGVPDLAVSCRILSCATILRGATNGTFTPVLSVDVPSGEFIASGDLDGDGHADLVGSGSVLWTALSSRRGQVTPPPSSGAPRPTATVPVINEILAINASLPVDEDGDRNSDWVELFHAGATAIPLNGWKLRLDANGTVNEFAFPPTAFFAPKTHLLIIFSETKRTLYHTGFRLPGEGGTLVLVDPAGAEVDRVPYGPQQPNVSYGRYGDGQFSFTSNPYPSPGRPNSDNGSVEPVADLHDYAPLPARPNEPIQFTVTGHDDVGIIGVSVLWQQIGISNAQTQRIPLYDDGMHGDGGVLDGVFSGLLEPGLPVGSEIQFYIETTDLSEQTVLLPNEPVFAAPGQPVTMYSLTVGQPASAPLIEISEIVASNTNGLRDDLGLTPDWVEIRNCSMQPVSLRGVTLAQQFFGNGSRYRFGESDALNAGEHRVIYCDGTTTNGPLHAPFSLSRDGDALVLTGLTTNGARTLLDSVAFGPQQTDVALARLGCGGPWRSTTPTPRAGNIAASWLGAPSADGSTFTLAFPTTTNGSYIVQFTDSLSAPSWQSLPAIPGNGLEKTVTQQSVSQRFYRVRRDP